jgi:DeoR/GlpR family transcriptional regulator of sugar metabolism
VIAAELSKSLGVSHDTVRRDLLELVENGLVQRVNGGALPPIAVGPNFRAHRGEAPASKRALARAAADLIRPGQLVVLDAGTTNECLARELPADLEATFFTNSPPVATALGEHPRSEVHMIGGRLDKLGLVNVRQNKGLNARYQFVFLYTVGWDTIAAAAPTSTKRSTTMRSQ